MHSPAALQRAALHGDALLALDRRQPPSLPTRLRCCERHWSAADDLSQTSGLQNASTLPSTTIQLAGDSGPRPCWISFTDTLASCGIPTAHRALFGPPRMIGAGMVLPNSRGPHSSSTV